MTKPLYRAKEYRPIKAACCCPRRMDCCWVCKMCKAGREGGQRNLKKTKTLANHSFRPFLRPALKHFLKEAALKTSVASVHHQEKVNRKTNRPVAGMSATLQRGLAQLTIPADFLS